MKSLFAFLIFSVFAFPLFLFAQTDKAELNPREEPYPAPVSYADISQLEAKFLSLFRNENVTNLHVYAIPSGEVKNGYPYEGTPITSEYNGFVTGNLAAQTFVLGEEPQAIMSMRGSGEELYLVRLPKGGWNGEIALFDMEDGKLRSRKVLAYRKCNSAKCVQLDSWLQDLNADGRLDIIQKRQTSKGYRESRPKVKVFLMTPDGTFKKGKKSLIDPNIYPMEKVD